MTQTRVLEQTKLAQPKLFKLFLLNDDTTTMDFVIEILMDIFHYDLEKATHIMLAIHTDGEGVAGIFTQEIALSKQKQVQVAAKEADFPLQTRIEEQ